MKNVWTEMPALSSFVKSSGKIETERWRFAVRWARMLQQPESGTATWAQELQIAGRWGGCSNAWHLLVFTRRLQFRDGRADSGCAVMPTTTDIDRREMQKRKMHGALSSQRPRLACKCCWHASAKGSASLLTSLGIP